ncbi:MAG: hypothetical protein ACYCST_21915 [Acidimicrobiales bacterium]
MRIAILKEAFERINKQTLHAFEKVLDCGGVCCESAARAVHDVSIDLLKLVADSVANPEIVALVPGTLPNVVNAPSTLPAFGSSTGVGSALAVVVLHFTVEHHKALKLVIRSVCGPEECKSEKSRSCKSEDNSTVLSEVRSEILDKLRKRHKRHRRHHKRSDC